jgi:alkanesulfonate monooxygenase SsuD/methylene tetrahydromethanopterin reductase-like flavin-dependent oxidoreductase (luciferase family)
MRIGLSISSSLVGSTPAEGARWMIERARSADGAELDSLSLGDHHAMARPYYQNTPMLGRLLAEWGRRPAGCLFLMPLWHPVLVAEHVGTLAAMTDAPFIVQTGIGRGHDQFDALGADHDTRGRVLEESVRVVKAILAGEDVESDLVGAPVSVGLRPTQDVEWWIGGGPSLRAIARAGSIGDAWYASPTLTADTAKSQLDVYNQACADAGRTPRPIARLDAIVLGEPGRARRVGNELIDAGYRGMRSDQVLMGDPEEAAAQLRRYGDLGFTDVICRCMSDNQAIALETIELLGDVRDRVA